MDTAEDKSAPAISEALSQNPILPFFMVSDSVEEGWLQGFREEIHGFKSAATFRPMIGSIPFMGYVFELEENADVTAFVNTLKEKANLRWMVCVEADEIVCEAKGNTVFFCMAKFSFED